MPALGLPCLAACQCALPGPAGLCALPCPACLPCPALPCPALPCPALPCPALPCPAVHARVPCNAQRAREPCPALTSLALPCPALLSPALLFPKSIKQQTVYKHLKVVSIHESETSA